MFSLIILPAVSFTRRMQVLINACYCLLFKIYRPMSCIAWRDGYPIQSIIYFRTNKQKKLLASLVQPDEKEEEKIH